MGDRDVALKPFRTRWLGRRWADDRFPASEPAPHNVIGQQVSPATSHADSTPMTLRASPFGQAHLPDPDDPRRAVCGCVPSYIHLGPMQKIQFGSAYEAEPWDEVPEHQRCRRCLMCEDPPALPLFRVAADGWTVEVQAGGLRKSSRS